jgi:AcrR family transcriptional regulator
VRADARRNHAKLIEAARRDFVAIGEKGALDEVARRAGVGIGTVYRHFPTREHLLSEAFTEDERRAQPRSERRARGADAERRGRHAEAPGCWRDPGADQQELGP